MGTRLLLPMSYTQSHVIHAETKEEGISQELIIAAAASAGGTAIVVGTLCLCFAALHHWRFKRRFGPNKEALTLKDYKIKT